MLRVPFAEVCVVCLLLCVAKNVIDALITDGLFNLAEQLFLKLKSG